MEKNYCAIDLGAESGRLIWGTLEDNKLEFAEIHRFPTKGTYLFNSFRWNVVRFWEEIKKGLKKAFESSESPLNGIAVDSWGVNLVYLTKDKELACLPFHYRDNIINIGDKVIRDRLSMEKVFEITGIQEMPINGLIHLFGIHQDRREILIRTKKICMIPDYINYLLTGRLTAEYTNASTTQILDAREKHWSEDLLKHVDLNPEYFPQILMPGDKIGDLHKSLCEELQIPSISVFSVGSHDTASAVAAIPAEGENWAYLSSGTWSLLGVEVDNPILTPSLREYNLTNEGGVFGKIRLLKNIMGLWLLQRCKAEWEQMQEHANITYDEITAEAEKIDTEKIIIDVDSPEFLNPTSMIDVIQIHCKNKGLTIPHTVGEITRCILESLAACYEETLKLLEQVSGRKVKILHIVGGGSKNELLNQITADRLGIPVLAGPVEATAIGNILMQAVADGAINSLEEIRAIVRNSFSIKKYLPR